MATQATSAANSLSLAPEQVNGSGTQTVQVQQPQAQAATGIAGNGQSTMASVLTPEEEFRQEFEKGMRAAQDPSFATLLYANSTEGRQVKLHSEVERAVTSVLLALCKKGFDSGSPAEVVEKGLKYCRAFCGAEMRSESVFVDGACGNAALYCPEVSTQDIRLYAASRGYRLEVAQEDKTGLFKRYARATEELSR